MFSPPAGGYYLDLRGIKMQGNVYITGRGGSGKECPLSGFPPAGGEVIRAAGESKALKRHGG